MTIDACKQRLERSYVYYAKYFPADTATIVKFFINEIDSALQLENTQKTSVAAGMQAALANNTWPSAKPVIDFLHIDVYPVLVNTLGLIKTNTFKEIYTTNRVFEQGIYNTLIDAYSNDTDKVLADYFRGRQK